jgi:transposase
VKKTTNQQEREEARELFHNKGLSIEELASRFGKTEA